MSNVSIIVTCKGRLSFLKQTLLNMLYQRTKLDYEVIVVDYGCPDDTADYCTSLMEERLGVIKVLDNTDPFNVSRARNCGAISCTSRVLTFLDADTLIQEDWLELSVMPVLKGNIIGTAAWLGQIQGGHGLISVRKEIFMEERGFDESMQSWGYEDDDFYNRVAVRGKMGLSPGPPKLKVIEHSDEIRTQNYLEKDKRKSHVENQFRAKNRGVVNPNGFGKGEIEVCDMFTIES